jgi:surface protein
MFYGAIIFNGSFGSKWDTKNVTDMSYMFNNATNFSGDISEWDTSKVTRMVSLFENASSFKDKLKTIDFKSVSKYEINEMWRHYRSSSYYWNCKGSWIKNNDWLYE